MPKLVKPCSATNDVLEQAPVVGLHDLPAALHGLVDEAGDVAQPVGRHAAALAEAPVNGRRIAVTKPLDDQVEHQAE